MSFESSTTPLGLCHICLCAEKFCCSDMKETAFSVECGPWLPSLSQARTSARRILLSQLATFSFVQNNQHLLIHLHKSFVDHCSVLSQTPVCLSVFIMPKQKKAGRVRKANDALFGQIPQDDVAAHEVAAESADSQKGTANTNPLTNPLTSKAPHTTPSASSVLNKSPATQETSTGQVDTASLEKEPTAFEKKLGVTLPSRESLLDFAEFARGQNLTPEVQRLAERIRKMGQSESQSAKRTDTEVRSYFDNFQLC